MLKTEFPALPEARPASGRDGVSRRGFLKVMGAIPCARRACGMHQAARCPIFPYVKQPEDLILGKPMYFATAFPFPTGAIPVLVKSDAFRPSRWMEIPTTQCRRASPTHSRQATLLDCTIPTRSKEVRLRGQTSEWADFQQRFRRR